MADPTTDDVTALGTLLAGEVDGKVDDLAAYILSSRWLAERDARVRAEAAAEVHRETARAIDAWETQESVDVLTKGAWSDGVRYGLEVARQIVERGESL